MPDSLRPPPFVESLNNDQINQALSELADLLEIRGANPFRVRAYRNAVRTIQGLTRPLAEMVEAGEDLTELPGIGTDMASHIRELLEAGSLQLLGETAQEVPRSLTALVKLEGLGPKKVKRLWEELGVTDLDELEEALEAGRVQTLDGFGKKSAEKALRSLHAFRKRQGRFLRAKARDELTPLLEALSRAPGVERLEVAGSFRRGRDTVGDADILARVEGGEEERSAVVQLFTSFPEVEEVGMAGDTRASVVLKSGFPVDLRIVPGESFGAALHYFTGSKEHNVRIRSLAQRKGLRVNEYGVFKVDDGGNGNPRSGTRVGGECEEEVFQAVGLPWIPPELREDRGEVEAAGDDALPHLVELEDVRGDLHMHSTWSDGRNSIREMVEACRGRGYEYMAITDHSQAVRVANGLTPERVRKQWEEVEEIRGEVEGIALLRGLEVDILKDGSLDMPDEILAELDVVLAAVHSHMGMEEAEMTRRIISALEHPAVNILVHPTGRLLTRRDPYAVDMEAVLTAAAELDVAVELNANPYRLDLHDLHVKRARELGLRISVATDAHRIGHLNFMEGGLLQARRGWLRKEDLLNSLSLDELRRRLGRRGKGA